MAVVYDLAITAARTRVNTHRALRDPDGPAACAAGCGDWPCRPYLLAFALITRNASGAQVR